MIEKINLSVIIPCWNEEKYIYELICKTFKKLDENKITFEVIVIDDDSSDETSSEIRKYNDSRLVFIRNSKNLGFGGAFWVGVQAARGEFVVMIPGDGQILIDDMADVFWLTESVDVVVPFMVGNSIRSLKRRVISKVYRSIVNLSFGLTLNYTNGNVMYRSSILKSIKTHSRSFFFQTEILVYILKSGYLYAEIPVKLNSEDSESSSALKIKSIVKVIFDYLRLLYRITIKKRNVLLPITEDSITKKKMY